MPEFPPLPPNPLHRDKAAGLSASDESRGQPKVDGVSVQADNPTGIETKPGTVPLAPPQLPPRPLAIAAEADDVEGWWSSEGRLESSAWLVSFLVHAIVLFLLGLITLSVRSGGNPMCLLASTGNAEAASVTVEQQPLAVEPSDQSGNSSKDDAAIDATPVDVPVEIAKVVPHVEKPEKSDNGRPPAPGARSQTTDEAQAAQEPTGGGWEGRDPSNRPGMAGKGGGTRQSEEAVERGLRWLAAHQRDDGSWCFDLGKPPCNGLCRNSGTEVSTTAATGLALLPFLGAGYTQLQGEHQETVKRGLYYLSTRAMVTSHGVDLRDGGNMYSQGIATLALCEAYGMTHDASLREIAQGAIRFIVYAQDLEHGGWRYTPGEPGDTTVTGWQLMALKSGQMAKLEVPSPTLGLVQRFFDSVQYDGGARYGYLTPTMRAKTQETTTAVALLCRMYLGWNRSRPALYRGVEHLHKWSFSKTNMYYDYYATQVLHHWQGPEWQAWNKPMRDYIVSTQSAQSHEAGSWYFPDPYGDRGGRLYNTAMAIMILEVYYRHMPLYGEEAIRRGL